MFATLNNYSTAQINASVVVQGVLQAYLGIEPAKTLFNESFSGRKLGDIDNNGTLDLQDVLLMTQYNAGTITNLVARQYITETMFSIFWGDPTKYAVYIHN